MLDENNRPKFVIDTFNIEGRYYRDLPEFLQKRFNKFNVNVTTIDKKDKLTVVRKINMIETYFSIDERMQPERKTM